MHYEDIAKEIIQRGLYLSLGATPARTVSYELTTAIKKEGADCPFQRIGKGQYIWKEKSGISKLSQSQMEEPGREVIYVGRAIDRPLGRRLYEHTLDRFSSRWDRFSWFGLLPVSPKGILGELPKSYEARKMIPAVEAIMIEALEPRQNRKRGDDLSAVEYIQKEDPAIKKKRALEVLNKLSF